MSLIICHEDLTSRVIGAAIEVHRELGPGFLESVYEAALCIELSDRQIKACRQVEVPVAYKGTDLGLGFRVDILVEDSLILEIKSCDGLNELHLAQVLNYLHLLKVKHGLLINFRSKYLKDGIKRVSI